MGYDTEKLVSGNVNGSTAGGPITVEVTFSPTTAGDLAMVKALAWVFDYSISATGSVTWEVELDDGVNAEVVFRGSDSTPSGSGSNNFTLADALGASNATLQSTDTIKIRVILDGLGVGSTSVTNSLVWLSGSLKT